MHEEISCLVGLDGFWVRRVHEDGDRLDLEVELIVGAGVCPRCGRASLEVKERPVVTVRDLPISGRRTYLGWRKRRYCCRGCRRTFSESHRESHPQLPARQRVTRRFRERLCERVSDGAAHTEVVRCERTTRYQVARAFKTSTAEDRERRAQMLPARRLSLDEAHHRRGHELATIVSDLDKRCVREVLVGCGRGVIESYLRSLSEDERRAIEVVSIDPYEAYRQAIRSQLPWARIVVDRFHLVRGANTALDSVRRERQRVAIKGRPKGARRAGHSARWRKDLYHARHRLLKARERLCDHERLKLCELFMHEPLIAEACGLKETFREIYRASDRAQAEQRLERFLAAVERSHIASFKAPTAYDSGARSYSPTSRSPPQTDTPRASSTRSRSSSAAPTDSPPSQASERESS